jgi:hypothetical protein
MPNKCKGILGFMFGHRFEAEYDDKIQYQDIKISEQLFNNLHILNGGYQTPILKDESIYVHSVCKRCGQIIKRESKNHANHIQHSK